MTITASKKSKKFVGRKAQNVIKRLLIKANRSHKKRVAYLGDSLNALGGNKYAAKAAVDTVSRSPALSKDLYKSVPKSAPASSYNIDNLTAVITFWGTTGASIGDITGDKLVNIDDLTKVILNWDNTPPSAPQRTPCGTINLEPGDHTIQNLDILWSDQWGKGVNGEGQGIKKVSLINVRIRSKNYGLYFAGCTSLFMQWFAVESGLDDSTGSDPYCIRGVVPIAHLLDGTFTNNRAKGVYRLYQCTDANLETIGFKGGRLMLGGGSSDEAQNQLPYLGSHHNCTYECESAQVYRASTLNDYDGVWTKTHAITVWSGGGLARFFRPTPPILPTGGGGSVIIQ